MSQTTPQTRTDRPSSGVYALLISMGVATLVISINATFVICKACGISALSKLMLSIVADLGIFTIYISIGVIVVLADAAIRNRFP